jgi:hypothetical protein
MLKTLVCLLMLAFSALAEIGPKLEAVTSAQAAFRYTRPDTDVCTWEASESETYSPLLDSLVNRQSDVGTQGERWFVLIALSDNTTYYWRQTCGSAVKTGMFTTKSIPVADRTSTAVHISMGGISVADSALIQYGTMWTLGSEVETACTPRCSTSINIPPDSILFFRHAYKRDGSVIAGPATIQAVAVM